MSRFGQSDEEEDLPTDGRAIPRIRQLGELHSNSSLLSVVLPCHPWGSPFSVLFRIRLCKKGSRSPVACSRMRRRLFWFRTSSQIHLQKAGHDSRVADQSAGTFENIRSGTCRSRLSPY